MVEPIPSACIAMNAISTPTGSMMMATSALRTCSRKTTQTRATMRLSSISVAAQGRDRAVNQVGAVVDRLDAHAVRQAWRDLGDLLP